MTVNGVYSDHEDKDEDDHKDDHDSSGIRSLGADFFEFSQPDL